MLNLRKTAVAVLALSSSAVFAGTMGPVCTPGNVTVPCERTAWNFGADALYLEVMNNDPYEYYAYPGTNGQTNYRDLANKYGWGFKIEGSYHFSTGNDINVNWYHVNANRTVDLAGATYAGTTSVVDLGNATFKPRWDQVNIEVGQFIDFGEYKDLRIHAGAQYSNIQRKQFSNFSATTAGVSTPYFAFQHLRYNGFGPRVGADLTYGFGNGLAVYGDAAAAVLVGTSKYDVSISPSSSTILNSYSSHRAVVPELDTKLGIKYDYAMPQGDLTLDVGWLVVNYFNARQRYTTKGDVALQGLYFGLKYVGAVMV